MHYIKKKSQGFSEADSGELCNLLYSFISFPFLFLLDFPVFYQPCDALSWNVIKSSWNGDKTRRGQIRGAPFFLQCVWKQVQAGTFVQSHREGALPGNMVEPRCDVSWEQISHVSVQVSLGGSRRSLCCSAILEEIPLYGGMSDRNAANSWAFCSWEFPVSSFLAPPRHKTSPFRGTHTNILVLLSLWGLYPHHHNYPLTRTTSINLIWTLNSRFSPQRVL